MNLAQALAHLRRANEVARAALAQGHHPFGAILVDGDGQTVLLEQGNVDSVNHAEAVLARDAAKAFSAERLWGCTLVTTVEPCAMCAGTQYWAHIGRLVYGLSEARLLQLTGNHAENPTLDLPCREVFARGQKAIDVIGPVAEAEDEIAALHRDFSAQPMSGGWRAQLSLHYTRDGDRTIALDRHEGPLRVLQRLYPEGPGICHHVIVHPPGGVVAGDRLEVDARLDAGTHAVVTTPGATRFYRSTGATAVQQARLQLADGARLEWLPLEAIAHRDCIAENRVGLALAPGAEAMGWDLLALGLPAAGEVFDRGSFLQHLELPGAWLERGLLRGDDTLLLDSPLGLGGQRVLATLWFAAGSAWGNARRDALLDAARAEIGPAQAGATTAHPQVVVLRALAARVEPAMQLLQRVRAAWRRSAWDLAAEPPRVWRT